MEEGDLVSFLHVSPRNLYVQVQGPGAGGGRYPGGGKFLLQHGGGALLLEHGRWQQHPEAGTRGASAIRARSRRRMNMVSLHLDREMRIQDPQFGTGAGLGSNFSRFFPRRDRTSGAFRPLDIQL
jgi:hypothetical protein